MMLTSFAAGLFLAAALPIGIYVSYSDLSRMKIPNVAVYALVAAYAVLGLIALPFYDYLWQWTHLVVMLVVGIALNAARVMGAGDAKFIAAAAPMVPLADAFRMIPIFAVSLVLGFIVHRVAKASRIRAMVPHWESWTAGKRFPMGFPLSMALIYFLAEIALKR